MEDKILVDTVEQLRSNFNYLKEQNWNSILEQTISECMVLKTRKRKNHPRLLRIM